VIGMFLKKQKNKKLLKEEEIGEEEIQIKTKDKIRIKIMGKLEEIGEVEIIEEMINME
jgi:hypothetical protein